MVRLAPLLHVHSAHAVHTTENVILDDNIEQKIDLPQTILKYIKTMGIINEVLKPM
jgi:hypothetical protein